MFLPYRTLGYVTDGNTPVIKRYGIQNFLFNTIGNSWQLFQCNRLRLRLASPEKESQISAIAPLDNQSVCTAVGREIIVWKRTQEALRLNPPLGNKISKLLSIGNVLITLSQDGHLYTWDLNPLNRIYGETELNQAITTITEDAAANNQSPFISTKTGTLASADAFEIDVSQFSPLSHCYLQPPFHESSSNTEDYKMGLSDHTITSIQDSHAPFVTSWTHPPTYQNKLVIGWSNGVVELWNIKSGKMIFRFTAHLNVKTKIGSKMALERDGAAELKKELSTTQTGKVKVRSTGSPITFLESANILDVIAIGCENGDIYMINLKLDELIHRYSQTSRVTALTFRTDDKWNHHLISTGADGSLTLWDLKEKSSVFTKRGLHTNGITFASFLFKEPILITSGHDNTLIQWHFDGINMTELRSRTGHYKPADKIKWYNFNTLITGSPDASLRYWAPNRDRSAFTLSWKAIPDNAHRSEKGEKEGYLEKRQRRISGIDLTPIYHSQQPSCVTLNSGETDKVTLWSIENKRAEFLIGHSKASATNTCFSHCGQFIFIGYKDGEIKKFNLQSRALRASFTPDRQITNSHGDDEIKQLTNKSADKQKRRKAFSQGAVLDKRSAHGTIPHQNGIVDIFCAQGNEFLVSIGKDGLIYTWDIDREAMLLKLQLDFQVHAVSFAPEHGLLGVVTSNNDVYLIDCERLVVVREWKFSSQISPDGRPIPKFVNILLHPHSALLFLSDNLGGLKTFDLTSGVQIDYTIFSRPILAFDICPPNRDSRSTGDIIATTHAGSVGIYLWVLNPNRQLVTSLTIHQQHLSASTTSTGQQPHHVSLSTGNKASSIDSHSLEKEQQRFYKQQTSLLLEHQSQVQDAFLEANADIDTANMIDESVSDSEETDDEIDDNTDQTLSYNHSLNPLEKAYYKKMKRSNHFLTVNVVRNMSIFDHLITKPKPKSKSELIPNEDDTEQEQMLKIQKVIQQVLFKQLHNEMNAKLAMLSGLSSSRWKLLTTKQAIAQRNEKIKQSQIMVNKNTPFFLNIQTAQKKGESSTTYNIDSGLNLAQQTNSIQNARNSEFSSHWKSNKKSSGGMVDFSSSSDDPFGDNSGNDEPADILTQCLNIQTIGNVSAYLWPHGGENIFAFDSDDSDDDAFISVNDRKRKEQQEQLKQTESYQQQEQLKQQSRKEREAHRRAEDKAKKDKEDAKKAKLQAEQKQFEYRRDLLIATFEHHYFHINAEHPIQSFIEEYNIKHPQSLSNTKKQPAHPNGDLQALFQLGNNSKISQSSANISSIVAKATRGKTPTSSKISSIKTDAQVLEEHRVQISHAYHSTLKDLNMELGFNKFSHSIQRRALSPLVSYILSTPPSLLSMQISAFDSERDLYIFLHTLYILASTINGGMLDAISSLLQHTLELHSLAISESHLLRFICTLLTKVLSSQWKSIEMLLHSNIAVVNQLAGLHQGF